VDIINRIWHGIILRVNYQKGMEISRFMGRYALSESNRELLISARRRHSGPIVIVRKQCDTRDEDLIAEMRTLGFLKADVRE